MNQNNPEFGNPAAISVAQEQAHAHISGWRATVAAGLSLIACAGVASEGYVAIEPTDQTAVSEGYSPDVFLDEPEPVRASTELAATPSSLASLALSAAPKTETYAPNYAAPNRKSVATTKITVIDDTDRNLPKLLKQLKKDVKANTDGSSKVVTKIKQMSKSAKRALNTLFDATGCLDDAKSSASFGATTVINNMPKIVRGPSNNSNDKTTEIVLFATDKSSCGGNFGVTSTADFEGKTVRLIDVTLGNVYNYKDNVGLKGKKWSERVMQAFGFVTFHEVGHQWGLGHAGITYSKDKAGNAYNLSSYSVEGMPPIIDLLNNIGEYDAYARGGDQMGYAIPPYTLGEINSVQGEMLSRNGFTNPNKYKNLIIGSEPVRIPAGDPKKGVSFGSIELGYSMPMQSNNTYSETIRVQSIAIQPSSVQNPDTGEWVIDGFEVILVDPLSYMVASVGKVQVEDIGRGIKPGTMNETILQLGSKRVHVKLSKDGINLQDVSPPPSQVDPYVSEGK